MARRLSLAALAQDKTRREESVLMEMISTRNEDAAQHAFDDNIKTQDAASERRRFSLTAAKDRAQLTATTAMSVVHVALLKSIIDAGKDANRYYAIVIGLISIAIGIQIVVGILAIFVTHIRNYYQTYRSDLCTELANDWCNCFSCCGRATTLVAKGVDKTGVAVGSDMSIDPLLILSTKGRIEEVASGVYDTMTVRLMQAELTSIEAQAELDLLKEHLASITDGADGGNEGHAGDGLFDAMKETGAEQVDENALEIQKQVLTIKTSMAKCEASIRRVDVLRSQEKVLASYVDDALAEAVLKKVSFWQNVINYLLYIVFICNAFITGLGVTGGPVAATSVGTSTSTGGGDLAVPMLAESMWMNSTRNATL